jgi:HEAT repeats/HEAT repeat
MQLKCLFGHEWHGCICSKCKNSRDVGHDWSKDCERCVRCGNTRTSAHDWSKDCEKCAKCGQGRKNAHAWSGGCKCTDCGAPRAHDRSSGSEKCARCGLTSYESDLVDSTATGDEYQLVYALNRVEKRLGRGTHSHIVELLIALLSHPYWPVRSNAATALGNTGDPRGMGPLAKALKDPNDNVRNEAVSALGCVGHADAVKLLVELVAHREWAVRFRAASGLGEVSDPRAIEPLVQALGDSQSIVRRYAAEALGKVGDSRAVQPLTKALDDSSEDVRTAAANGLGKIASKSADAEKIRLEELVTRSAEAQAEHKGRALKAEQEAEHARAAELGRLLNDRRIIDASLHAIDLLTRAYSWGESRGFAATWMEDSPQYGELRELGRSVDKHSGLNGMIAVIQLARRNYTRGYTLDHFWDKIGGWRA